MDKKLFLLDGMAIVYRAHFAFINRPIRTSKGLNTSALFGFTQSLLDILKNQQPTHLAVAFDTEAPTQRHREFAAYKAEREAMPEELSRALPHVRRLLEAFNIPALTCDGYEADDIIGTLVRRAARQGFKSYMVTLDKDLGQLVSEDTLLYKLPRMGEGGQVMGVPEILQRWNIQRPEQVADILALMGDSSDNIPGVPGIGEKTAIKLIGQFGSVEDLLARVNELSGKLRENLEAHRDQALLSKRLATIDCNVPCEVALSSLALRPPDDEPLQSLLIEFEFNSLGRRIYGQDFKAGRGFQPPPASPAKPRRARAPGNDAGPAAENLVLFGETEAGQAATPEPATAPGLKTLADVPHDYRLITTPAARAELLQQLQRSATFCFDTETTHLDPREARLLGIAFSLQPHTGCYVPLPADAAESRRVLDEFRAVFESEQIEKVGHNLKFDLGVLQCCGIAVRGKLFDTMIAHSLVEPELRHNMDYLAEACLGYSPVPIEKLIGEKKAGQGSMADVPLDTIAEYAAEDADVTLQLRAALEPLLKQKGQERVFYDLEAPLIPVLADMENEGIRVDAVALKEFADQLAGEMAQLEGEIYRLAGTKFNLNSPRQLGQVLFDLLKLADAPKKTPTGQYATDEATLIELAAEHEIVRRLLDYRAAAKLKSTYADALPAAISPGTGRVHTTYQQTMTATGRLSSQNPNLQNIPIRTERGQEIRKAFVPRDGNYLLLSADYSQIELRIIAALSREPGLLEAFHAGQDIHTATAAKVYDVPLDAVTPEMRRNAKMVNYGIAYGISAFGLAQRLGIPRAEGAQIIDQYFRRFPGIRNYMNDTIAFARAHGYVETVTGRRRYIRDITSANNTLRAAAERNAINAPIQGTAADLIKLAMIRIHRELTRRKLRTRMLLQVHDELVFDLFKAEEQEVLPLVEEKMKTALPLDVPMVVELGVGDNWLAAH